MFKWILEKLGFIKNTGDDGQEEDKVIDYEVEFEERQRENRDKDFVLYSDIIDSSYDSSSSYSSD
jgi:hypothetical protein